MLKKDSDGSSCGISNSGSAEASAGNLRDKVVAMMEVFHQINREDASIAQFVGAARIDLRRHPDIFAGVNAGLDGDAYYRRLVDEAVERGEIDAAEGETVRHFLRAISVGLTDGVSHEVEEHRRALDGLLFILDGGLAGS